MKFIFLLEILLFTNILCAQKEKIQIEKIENENLEILFKQEQISYEKIVQNNDDIPASAWLVGEKEEVLYHYITDYFIDWKNEQVFPNVYYNKIPLREPVFLVDKNKKGRN